MTLAPRTTLGRYEIVASLGAGGMGEVYRARDTRLRRFVALKVLNAAQAPDPLARERFEREARTASSLSHPNICPLFDVGEQDGQPYFVMECLEGQTLAARLEPGALPLREVVKIAQQIASGLDHAHAAGVIHRDLKPGNVMVLPDGTIKILDFGLARKAAGAADVTLANLTEIGITSGTTAYMSPEQTLGQPLDNRTDIFSLGVVCYEMLTGGRPFAGSSVFAVMQNVVNSDPRPVQELRAGLPAALVSLVTAMLSKPREGRPRAPEVAAALGALAGTLTDASAPALPAPATSVGVAVLPLPRRLPRAGIAAAVVVVGAASLLLVPALRESWFERFGSSRGSTAAPALPQTAAEWIRQGRAYLGRYDQKGNIDRAIESFQQAIAVDGSSAAALAGLSEAFRQKDSMTPDPQLIRQAIDAGQRAVTLNPDLAASHAALGAALLRAKQTDAGKTEIDTALDQDPSNLTALLALGEMQLASGQAAQAEATYRRAQQAAPADWVPAQLLGRTLFAQAKYRDAAAIWEDADRRTPDNVQILRNLGAVYQMMDRNDEAIAVLQRALAIDPTATVYNNLGTIRFFQGRYADATAAFEKAVELNPSFFLYWANLGDAYRWAPGGTERATQAYSRAIALIEERLRSAPDDPDERTRLALYLAKYGDPDGAGRELARWQSTGRRTAASHFRALVVHELRGERDQALSALDEALSAGYAARDIHNEPELTKLRTDPRYHKILAVHDTAPAR